MKETVVDVRKLIDEELLKHIEFLKEEFKKYQKHIKWLKCQKYGDDALLNEIAKLKVKDAIRMCEEELIKRNIEIKRF